MIYLCYSSAEAEFAGDAPAACASATGAPTVRSSTAGTGGNEMEKKIIINWSRCLKAGELFLESLIFLFFFLKDFATSKVSEEKEGRNNQLILLGTDRCFQCLMH